jgi:hypothetical protein
MAGFNKYAAGAKHYGGGRSMPSIGPNSKVGYRYRDNKAKARRNAVLRRMKAVQRGTAYMNRGGV